ncbi:MAG: Rrf2 family transcriptional regulator [Sphaerochaetaceae bacterium]|nr:Rrf2 family transcriptional regulator [Sphaerochaetaceae bacterium]
MKITSRFTVAVHTLLAIHTFGKDYKTTSEFIASSVNVNPVIIRRTLGSLKEAGIVDVKAGSGGASIIKPLKDITLLDVYKAVDSVEDGLFNFHDNPNPACPVGKNIHAVLDGHLLDAQAAMERKLRETTFADLVRELDGRIG